jgi:hypothetical protein
VRHASTIAAPGALSPYCAVAWLITLALWLAFDLLFVAVAH